MHITSACFIRHPQAAPYHLFRSSSTRRPCLICQAKDFLLPKQARMGRRQKSEDRKQKTEDRKSKIIKKDNKLIKRASIMSAIGGSATREKRASL